MKRFGLEILAAFAMAWAGTASAETIRVALGTQDTTINCATGGLIVREFKLLEKYLPRDGKYKDVTYDIEWKNFTSGAAAHQRDGGRQARLRRDGGIPGLA